VLTKHADPAEHGPRLNRRLVPRGQRECLFNVVSQMAKDHIISSTRPDPVAWAVLCSWVIIAVGDTSSRGSGEGSALLFMGATLCILSFLRHTAGLRIWRTLIVILAVLFCYDAAGNWSLSLGLGAEREATITPARLILVLGILVGLTRHGRSYADRFWRGAARTALLPAVVLLLLAAVVCAVLWSFYPVDSLHLFKTLVLRLIEFSLAVVLAMRLLPMAGASPATAKALGFVCVLSAGILMGRVCL